MLNIERVSNKIGDEVRSKNMITKVIKTKKQYYRMIRDKKVKNPKEIFNFSYRKISPNVYEI